MNATQHSLVKQYDAVTGLGHEAPATDKQVSFINSLLTSRETAGTRYEGHLSAPVLTKAQAREAISALLDLPKLSDQAPVVEEHLLPFEVEQVAGDPYVPGYFTVVHEEGGHTTYRFTRQKDDADFMPGLLLVGRLVGKDNETDYLTVGHVTEGDHVAKVWQRHQDPTNRIQIDLDTIKNRRDETGKNYAVESHNCWACGRILTDTDNPHFEIGLGPKCAKKLGY